jgi:hypothetical protein
MLLFVHESKRAKERKVEGNFEIAAEARAQQTEWLRQQEINQDRQLEVSVGA